MGRDDATDTAPRRWVGGSGPRSGRRSGLRSGPALAPLLLLAVLVSGLAGGVAGAGAAAVRGDAEAGYADRHHDGSADPVARARCRALVRAWDADPAVLERAPTRARRA